VKRLKEQGRRTTDTDADGNRTGRTMLVVANGVASKSVSITVK
jgi:hypothetical protein